MSMTQTQVNIDALLDDRPQQGIFRVHRDAFTSREVFDLEVARLFEGGWVFVGMESELAGPNSYKTLDIGRYPLLLTRDNEGDLHCFINSCRHRGMVLASHETGTQRYHTCRYHGWVFGSDGKNVAITQERSGRYPSSLAQERRDLEPVARFANYRGFLFASLVADVPPIEAHLGEARKFLDLIAVKAKDGLEYVPGAGRYTYRGNWKLQLENALDIYHFAYTHASYVDLLGRRDIDPLRQQAPGGPPGLQGSFGFNEGHAVQWRENARISPDLVERRKATYTEGIDEGTMRWTGYGVNITIFPNLQLVENVSSLILRVLKPLAPDMTEMEVHCLAPVGESAELREGRIRDYEDFFGAGGFATPDDSVIYELSQRGLQASRSEWTLGYMRGMDRSTQPQDNGFAKDLSLSADDWSLGDRNVGDETRFHATYRTWKARLG